MAERIKSIGHFFKSVELQSVRYVRQAFIVRGFLRLKSSRTVWQEKEDLLTRIAQRD
ncbi:hypothetical protein [Falsochrobactrum shanghaiense]|uniref:hypothetical protein n=1 Tax=Falsochrobactrum shanghaiense TaxID=2201899 RepID=UPI001304BD95|nr:hypothetical protein [Falsochrobactrum shanghaiense]